MTDIFPARLLMVGCGNMAGQMLRRWIECGLDPARVRIVDLHDQAPAGVRIGPDYPADLPDGSLVLLGVKPQTLPDVAAKLEPLIGPGIGLLSILAGTPLETLRARFPRAGSVTRIMPNAPAGLGKGVVALFRADGPDDRVTAMMKPLGLVEWVGQESDFDLVTALSGCGPAFLFRFIDSLGRAAADLGLPADQAARMALATVEGAAALAAAGDADPGTLADRVASPGGMTREGLNILDEGPNGLQSLMDRTLRAARDRGQVLARGG